MSHRERTPVYGRPITRDLDAERERVRHYLAAFIARYGYAPSYTQITSGARLPSKSYIASILDSLAAEGIIERTPGIPRSIRIVG